MFCPGAAFWAACFIAHDIPEREKRPCARVPTIATGPRPTAPPRPFAKLYGFFARGFLREFREHWPQRFSRAVRANQPKSTAAEEGSPPATRRLPFARAARAPNTVAAYVIITLAARRSRLPLEYRNAHPACSLVAPCPDPVPRRVRGRPVLGPLRRGRTRTHADCETRRCDRISGRGCD